MTTLDAVIATFGPALARVAASYEADPALREDLLQEILMAIHRALPNLRDQDRLAPFLFRIAHNRGVTHVLGELTVRRGWVSAAPDEREVQTPEHLAIARERAERLAAAVRRLALPYRQVLTLVLEEMSHAEIADTLGLTVSNVAVRVNRAKTMLKEQLGDD